jgi:hypothetical protein
MNGENSFLLLKSNQIANSTYVIVIRTERWWSQRHADRVTKCNRLVTWIIKRYVEVKRTQCICTLHLYTFGCGQ